MPRNACARRTATESKSFPLPRTKLIKSAARRQSGRAPQHDSLACLIRYLSYTHLVGLALGEHDGKRVVVVGTVVILLQIMRRSF